MLRMLGFDTVGAMILDAPSDPSAERYSGGPCRDIGTYFAGHKVWECPGVPLDLFEDILLDLIGTSAN